MDYEDDVKKYVERRKAYGLTQADISKDSGLSQQMVSDFESLKKKSFPLYFYYRLHFERLEDRNNEKAEKTSNTEGERGYLSEIS